MFVHHFVQMWECVKVTNVGLTGFLFLLWLAALWLRHVLCLQL